MRTGEANLKEYALCAGLFVLFLIVIGCMSSPAPIPYDEADGYPTTGLREI